MQWLVGDIRVLHFPYVSTDVSEGKWKAIECNQLLKTAVCQISKSQLTAMLNPIIMSVVTFKTPLETALDRILIATYTLCFLFQKLPYFKSNFKRCELSCSSAMIGFAI